MVDCELCIVSGMHDGAQRPRHDSCGNALARAYAHGCEQLRTYLHGRSILVAVRPERHGVTWITPTK